MATGGVNDTISDILENIVSDPSLESLVDTLAEKFGLSFKNSTTQTAVYKLSTVAVLETAQNVIGIGTGIAKGDLTGFTLAQIKSKLENIEQKLNIILDAPIKLALKYFSTAMTAMEFENIKQAVAVMDKVNDQAMLAYEYSIPEQKWEQAVLAKKLKIMATTILHSADEKSNTIIPFHVLKDNSKKMIAVEIEKDVIEAVDLPKKIKSKRWLPMSDREKKWSQNLANEILMPAYQYLSHGFGWSSPLSPPFDWKYKGCYLPVGAESKAPLSIVIEGKMEQVHLWREKDADGVFKIRFSCEAGHIINTERMISLEELYPLGDMETHCCNPILGWNNGWSNPRSPLNTWKFRGQYLPEGRDKMATLSVEKNGKMEPVYIWREKDVVFGYNIYLECAAGHTQCRWVWDLDLDTVFTWSDVNTECCDTRHHWTQVKVEWLGKIICKVGAYKVDKTWYLPVYWGHGRGPWLRNKTDSSSSVCPVSGWERRKHGRDEWRDDARVIVYSV